MNSVQTYGAMKYKSTQRVFPPGYLTFITFQSSSNYLCFQKLIYYKISPKYNTLAAVARSICNTTFVKEKSVLLANTFLYRQRMRFSYLVPERVGYISNHHLWDSL